jgi:hypothetical protein
MSMILISANRLLQGLVTTLALLKETVSTQPASVGYDPVPVPVRAGRGAPQSGVDRAGHLPGRNYPGGGCS